MRWCDLALDATPPTLTIRGGKARKRVDVLPLHPDLVRELRAVFPRAEMPAAPLFLTAVTHATRRADFKRAGIDVKTDDGYADLHALRHTFGTRLAQQSIPMATLQRLMRHATITLTMNYYVHLDVCTPNEGLAALPGIDDSDASEESAVS